MAPARTPKPIVDKLHDEIQKMVNSAEIKEAWAKQGAEPMKMSTGEFTKYLNGDIAKWSNVVKVSGAKVE